MATTENEKFVHLYFEDIINQRNLELADDLFSPDFRLLDPTGPSPKSDREGFKRFMRASFQAFPDLHFTVDQVRSAGSELVADWTATGTHKADFLGIPPSGKPRVLKGKAIFSIENSKIKQVRLKNNILLLIQQFGLIGLLKSLWLKISKSK